MRPIRTIIISLLITISCLAAGQDRVSFSGIQLGGEYRPFIKELKSRGFKIEQERDGEDYLYGMCKECFLTGKIDDNPAAVHITASSVTRTVFKVEAVLHEFIDQEEAVEEADRLLPQLRDEYQFRKTEVEMPGVTIIEMPSDNRLTTMYMCYPVAGMRIRYYESREKMDADKSFGSVSIKVYQNSLGHEHIIVLDYYDIAAGDRAALESGKGTKRALTIFIGDYPQESGWNRIASQNDKTTVLNVLYSIGFKPADVKVLEEDGATYDAIISSLADLASKARPGDEIYVHFSCHGQQITDQDGDEALVNKGDKLDEAIVPYDAAVAYNWHGYTGDKHLIDDVLNGYFSKIQASVGPQGSLLVVYDACHSGDADRETGENGCPSFRGAYDAFKQPLKAREGVPTKREVSWVSISACKDFQTNFEVCVDGQMYGRLSYAISRCLKPEMSVQELILSLQKEYETLPMPEGKHQSLQYYFPEKSGVKLLF